MNPTKPTKATNPAPLLLARNTVHHHRVSPNHCLMGKRLSTCCASAWKQMVRHHHVLQTIKSWNGQSRKVDSALWHIFSTWYHFVWKMPYRKNGKSFQSFPGCIQLHRPWRNHPSPDWTRATASRLSSRQHKSQRAASRRCTWTNWKMDGQRAKGSNISKFVLTC